MRALIVLPEGAADRVAPLLGGAGWSVEPAPGGLTEDTAAAVVALARAHRSLLFVPGSALGSGDLHRIMVVHAGSRGERAAVDAADEAAARTGAEVVVLHIPALAGVMGSASLPFRMADHDAYDWAEWRDEFLRRFCRCSEGVRVSLRVALGVPGEAFAAELAALQPELVALAALRYTDADFGPSLDLLLEAARSPVLIVPPIGQGDSASIASISSAISRHSGSRAGRRT